MKRLAAFFLLFALPLSLSASPHATTSDKMAPLAGLIGEWRGSGWMTMPDGTKSEFESRETVTPRLSGAALLVEGKHWVPGHPDQVVHDAMAMITWDSRENSYRFRSALANGRGADFPLEVGENRFVWRLDAPGAKIEFEAEFDENTWHETGRRILPDGTSVEFFGMTLTRQR